MLLVYCTSIFSHQIPQCWGWFEDVKTVDEIKAGSHFVLNVSLNGFEKPFFFLKFNVIKRELMLEMVAKWQLFPNALCYIAQ